jgi:tetratricopeptide (TPR) repeat protein
VFRRLITVALFGVLALPSGAIAQATPPVSGASPSDGGPVGHSREPISDQVADAEAAIAGTDWKTAEAKLDSWLAAHPADPRALFDAGYVADVQDRRSDAEALYLRAIAADGSAFDPRLLLGLLLARQGKTADARVELIKATELDPGEGGPELKARAWRAITRIDRDSDPATASNDLLEALKLSPETTDDTLLAADLAARSGKLDAAESEYRRVLAKDPASEPANTGLAHVLIRQQHYAEAETLLRAALEHSPDDPALTAQLAAVLAAQDKGEALPLLEKLHAAHPADVPIARMLAEVLADAGEFAESDELYVKLLATAPEDPVLLVGHGQNLVRQTRYAAAFAAFDKATQLDPANADGWSGLAFTASRTDRPSVTLHALTMRSKYMPENASTYFLWAKAYDLLHENTQAASYYHHFLEASAGKYPGEEVQAKERLKVLEK